MSLQFDPDRYLNQPFEVSIETMTLCNAACTFCTYPALERQGVSMSNELLLRLVDEMATFEEPFYFSPFKVNEPFLDKRTIALLQTVNHKAPHARLRLFTNGTPITMKLSREINALQNVEHLWISLNSIDQQDYKHLMGLDLKQTMEKLDRLHDAKHNGEFKHDVVVSRVAGSYEHNIAFVEYVKSYWPLFSPVIIKRDGWLGDIDAPQVMIPNTPCVRWWELSIMSTGVVSLCCMDGEGKFAIGDVSKTSMLAVYNAPGYRERREKMPTRKAVFPCATCSY